MMVMASLRSRCQVSDFLLVIPDALSAIRNPGATSYVVRPWVPGSMLPHCPGMTMFD